MTGFEEYTKEMEDFETSKLYKSKYRQFTFLLDPSSKWVDEDGKTVKVWRSDKLEKSLMIDGAKIRLLVKHARRNGILICSSKKGYWTADNWEEFAENTKHLEERAYSLLGTLAMAKKNSNSEQLELAI